MSKKSENIFEENKVEDSKKEEETKTVVEEVKTEEKKGKKAKEESKNVDPDLEVVLGRLDVLGIKYNDDITLKEAIKLYADKMVSLSNTVKPTDIDGVIRQYNKDQALRLIRVRTVCMNPAKKDMKGEYFTIYNRTIGHIKKFVPYNDEASAIGWHIPFCLYKHLTEREYYHASTRKGANGEDQLAKVVSKEFAIEVLEPLTQEEIDEIAKHQRANNTVR